MTLQRKSSPDEISIDQEDTIKQNLSGKASSGNNTMQHTQPSNSVKLDLTDGQSLYAKLVVIVHSGFCISFMSVFVYVDYSNGEFLRK